MMRTALIPIVFISLISCSSMPKDAKDQGIMVKKEQAASVLEHGNSEYLWENHASSINQYEQAFRLSASVDWQEGMVRSLIALSRSSDAIGESRNAAVYLERAEYLLSEIDDEVLALSAANRRCEWLLFNSSAEDALKENDSLIRNADKLQGTEAGECWRIRAAVLKRLGKYEKALEAAENALKLDEKSGALREAASDHYIRSSILSLSGRSSEAAEAMLSALALDKRVENTPGIAQDLYALGLIYEKSGEGEKGTHYFRRSALVYESAGILNLPEGLVKRLGEDSEENLWKTEKDQ